MSSNDNTLILFSASALVVAVIVMVDVILRKRKRKNGDACFEEFEFRWGFYYYGKLVDCYVTATVIADGYDFQFVSVDSIVFSGTELVDRINWRDSRLVDSITDVNKYDWWREKFVHYKDTGEII